MTKEVGYVRKYPQYIETEVNSALPDQVPTRITSNVQYSYRKQILRFLFGPRRTDCDTLIRTSRGQLALNLDLCTPRATAVLNAQLKLQLMFNREIHILPRHQKQIEHHVLSAPICPLRNTALQLTDPADFVKRMLSNVTRSG
jgi:hypothetical protein